MMLTIIFLFAICTNVAKGVLHLEWEAKNPPFDPEFYENLLDPELCQDQLSYLVHNDSALLFQFTESGLRIPRGITQGNLEDWGIYHHCIDISKDIKNSIIEGKYCFINVPANQSIDITLPSWVDFNPKKLVVDKETEEDIYKHNKNFDGINGLTFNTEQRSVINQLQGLSFKLAVCLPKPCTTQEALNSLFNLTSVGFQYDDIQCRVKHDKLWAPVDYVAIATFSLLGVITLFSTGYDIWHSILLKTDPKTIKPMCKAFSLYTNTRQLLTFTKNPNALECVDGIRALAMVWVIIGHTFSTMPATQNLIDVGKWITSWNSIWISSAAISVDTFFILSGMLLVYTTAGKMTGMKLLTNLHLFYLNRLLRMFPLLAATILLQASIVFWMSDGPVWDNVTVYTENCRIYWWSTLLYVQNYVNPETLCLIHSFYLAIDMQLYIISPLVLFWMLSGKKIHAWTSITIVFMAFLISSTVYNFVKEFQAFETSYWVYYYYNTLTRATPFFVGMMFGYLLHLYRGKKVNIPKVVAVIIWIITFTLTTAVIYCYHEVTRNKNWDTKIAHGLINSFIRPIWAAGIGWIIFACHHGYGGPINWILSLQMWKLISRISYGMYLLHFPIMFVTAATAVAPIRFTVISTVYRFLSEFSIAFMVSFVATVFLDAPFSNISKQLLGGGPKKPREEKEINKEETLSNGNGHLNRNTYDDNTIVRKLGRKM